MMQASLPGKPEPHFGYGTLRHQRSLAPEASTNLRYYTWQEFEHLVSISCSQQML